MIKLEVFDKKSGYLPLEQAPIRVTQEIPGTADKLLELSLEEAEDLHKALGAAIEDWRAS